MRLTTFIRCALKTGHAAAFCTLYSATVRQLASAGLLQFSPVADPARGRGGMAPLLAAWQFFRQYINIITKPTGYDGPRKY